MGTTKYASTLIAVTDMEKSRQFYHDVLGMNAVADFGANVTLDGGVVLQTLETWTSFIRTDKVVLPNNAGELYFEEEDMDAFCEHLKQFDICYVHPLFEHRWGQRVVRFYDPDKHIIEVGEKLGAVILRFMEQGLSVQETAVRMDIPVDMVTACLEKRKLTENMIRWAESKLGSTEYAGWCLSFIEDALEKPNGIEIFGGDSAKESAVLYADAMRKGVPERGAFVFYDCLCPGENGPVNWGHCGVSLGDGRVIHAWDMVRIDDYLAIEKLTALTGDHPEYLGWVALERVLNQKPSV